MDAHDRSLAPADWLRASSWVIALGVGLAGVGSALVGPLADGYMTPARFFLSLARGIAWFGGTLAGIVVVPVALAGLAYLAERIEWHREQRLGPSEPEPVAPDATRPHLWGGLEAMTDAERYVQEGLRRTLEHARRAGGLTGEDIGHAYGRTEHWVWWTDVLALSGLAVKVNGKPTVLPPGKTFFWAIRQVRGGYFEMPDPLPRELPPQPVAPPPRESESTLAA